MEPAEKSAEDAPIQLFSSKSKITEGLKAIDQAIIFQLQIINTLLV
jgi:hypothetical protein